METVFPFRESERGNDEALQAGLRGSDTPVMLIRFRPGTTVVERSGLETEYGKPIFGPATRALPQLPITVNDEGYLVATGDFNEPVGPAFWELRSS